MKKLVVIPARYASQRLPGKPLLDIAGKPMIHRVYDQAAKSSIQDIIVATDDERIKSSLEDSGYAVCMTRDDHPSGTDRLAEVAEQLKLHEDDIVINVQGDEPLIPVAVIEQVAQLLSDHPDASIATLSTPITENEVLQNPNVVKVIANAAGRAIYFSRAPIPWHRNSRNHSIESEMQAFDYQRHIGIYAYRAGFLRAFANWDPCQLEITESLEQLRAIWHGHVIQVALACETVPEGIDTPEDLQTVRSLFA